MEKYQVKEATLQFMKIARAANKYFNDQEPWKTRNSDPEKCATTLYICLETVKTLAIVMRPFLPFTSDKIWQILNLDIEIDKQPWLQAGELTLKHGEKINKPEILFDKVEDDVIQEEIARLKKISESPVDIEELDLKPEISIEDFNKIDLRTGKILTAEKIKGAKKLLKLNIQIGPENKQIVAGIAEFYIPEDIMGKQVIVVANLKPVVLRGVKSEGMLLAVEDDKGLTFISPDGKTGTGYPVK